MAVGGQVFVVDRLRLALEARAAAPEGRVIVVNADGTYTITVTSPTAFTYTMASNAGGSATTIGHLIGPGAAVVDFTGARDDRWTGGVLGGVLVMNNGDIVEQGNHEELIEKGGFYANLYNSQFERISAE